MKFNILVCLLILSLSNKIDAESIKESPRRSRAPPPVSTQAIDFDCPEEFGYYAHPTDCTQYYVCVFGGALLESCTGGLMYSHELQTCDWPRNVGCAPGSTAQIQQQPIQQREPEIRSRGQTSSRLLQQQQGQQQQQQHQQQQQQQQHQHQHQHRTQQQTIPAKHDLYTEEEQLGPAEELESDRQQRVYRGQPPTIGQVASDRDAITHSNAIPVPSGGREKLSVVSFGTQQQYTRASVTPAQQSYVDQQQNTVPSRGYNTSRYVPSQYDPPYYSLYDEEDLYKEIGDFTQYNSQSNYRQPSYKEKKPQIEIVQQEPVQRGATYSKSKYSTQSQDLYQSVTPQEYDTYSIQTNDDLPFRQTIQKASTRSSGVKEIDDDDDDDGSNRSRLVQLSAVFSQQESPSASHTGQTEFNNKITTPQGPTAERLIQTAAPFRMPEITTIRIHGQEPRADLLTTINITPKSPIRIRFEQTDTDIVDNATPSITLSEATNRRWILGSRSQERRPIKSRGDVRGSTRYQENPYEIEDTTDDAEQRLVINSRTGSSSSSQQKARENSSRRIVENQRGANLGNSNVNEELERRVRLQYLQHIKDQEGIRLVESDKNPQNVRIVADRFAEEVEKKAREDARRREIEEIRVREDARRKQVEEALRKSREETRRKQAEEAERKAVEEARRKKIEEEERKAKEEARRRQLEEAERKAKEEARRRQIEEEERKAKEEARRRQLEEAERKAKEEARRRQIEEAERKAREEARRKQLEEAERKAAEEARLRKIKEDERKAKEETRRRQIEEEEWKARVEARQRQIEESLKKAKEDAIRKQQEQEKVRRQELVEAERKATEDSRRRQQLEEGRRRTTPELERTRQSSGGTRESIRNSDDARRRTAEYQIEDFVRSSQIVRLSNDYERNSPRQQSTNEKVSSRGSVRGDQWFRIIVDNQDNNNNNNDAYTTSRSTAPFGDTRPPKKYVSRNSTLINELYINEQVTNQNAIFPVTTSSNQLIAPQARTYTTEQRNIKTLDKQHSQSKSDPDTDDKSLRARHPTFDTQSTPGISRGNSRHRGSQTYTLSPNEAEPAPAPRGTPAAVRGRPTLKPSTTVVGKASEYVDIYRYPPRRPENIYPTPQVDKTAAKCRKDVCLLPDCSCGGKEVPGDLRLEETPQIVLLTFDDSVNDLNKGLYSDLFEKGRTNPNGCPISATFYVSHEWTDYSQVQNLYAGGHEIASHSVSHSFGEQFSQRKWTREIAGQREILSAYGGVKLEDIRGMRAPFLAIGGNKMFKMLYDSNFTYDSSMPVYENRPPSWPYTLDYKVFHDCMIPPCPTRSYPGVWEMPMVMWQDLNGGRCSMGDACSNPPSSEGVYKMLIKNFERHFTTNRSPFGLFYHAAWFTQPHHKEGFIAFLDTINKMPEVWLISNWQAIQWIRDPTPISRLNNFAPFQCNYPDRPKKCNNPKVCNLWHKSGVRYMRTCQPCPEVYPWTGKSGVRNSRVDNEIINE